MSSLDSEQKDRLLQRLRRIEGQVRGLQRMIGEDKYCVEILIQIAAARAALNKVGLEILRSHTEGCVTEAIKQGDSSEKIKELMDVITRFTG